jgi:hypothetical protein
MSSVESAGPCVGAAVVPDGLLDRLAEVPDPRDPRGVRYRLASLLAIGVCAVTASGHDSLAAIAEWVRRAGHETLRRLGLPFHPLTGRYRCPDERTLRDAYAQVDAAALTQAGFARLATLTGPVRCQPRRRRTA